MLSFNRNGNYLSNFESHRTIRKSEDGVISIVSLNINSKTLDKRKLQKKENSRRKNSRTQPIEFISGFFFYFSNIENISFAAPLVALHAETPA